MHQLVNRILPCVVEGCLLAARDLAQRVAQHLLLPSDLARVDMTKWGTEAALEPERRDVDGIRIRRGWISLGVSQ